MSRHQHPPKRHQRAAGQAPSAPLAWLLRDPHSTEELRRTIDAWTRFIERHLQDEDADVRAFAQMAIVRRAAADWSVTEVEYLYQHRTGADWRPTRLELRIRRTAGLSNLKGVLQPNGSKSR